MRSRWLDIGQVRSLRVYGPRRSRGPSTRKKRMRPISSHLDRTNLVNKGFIIWLLVKFCLRDTAGSPERARWLHLARSGSESQRTIWFILPAHGASHIINISYWTFCCVVSLIIIWLCLTRTGNYQIHEFDWLKRILTAV